MTPEVGFLRAMQEDEDDTSRLIFADWLDEHGQPDRAEFIRLQCRLAKQVVPDVEGRLRAEDLLDAHEHEWLEGLPQTGEIRPHSFQRGFLSWVDVDSMEAFRRHAAALRQTTARNLRFTDEDGSLPADWPEWAGAEGLTGLFFELYKFDPAETALLAASPHVAGLRSLGITTSEFDSDSMAVLAASPRFAALTDLDLRSDLVCAEGVRALARSDVLLGLRSLVLDHISLNDHAFNRIEVEAVIALSRAENLRGLTSLCLGCHKLSEKACEALASSPYLQGLRSLALAARHFVGGHHDLRPLFGSPFLNGLEHLELRGMPLIAENVREMATWPAPPNLRSLTLDVQCCGTAGLEAVLGSAWASGLRRLRLSEGPCRGADGFELERSPVLALAKAGSLAGLCELDVWAIQVGDEQLAALAGSPYLSRLISLKLGYAAPTLTTSGVRRLAESATLPALRRLSCRGFGKGGIVIEALDGTPLASRLTALNLRRQHLCPRDVRPLLDRSRWPRLVRLDLAEEQDLDEEVRLALKECWGPAVNFDNKRGEFQWYD
jgi:uncharacterized protein (TIGR02996 family)